jgi:hypothetical protein
MKKVILYLLSIFVLIVLFGFQTNQLNKDDPPGKEIFIENKCGTCHSVEAADITLKKKKKNIPDLSDVGTKLDPSFIKKWVLKEESINGVKHMYSYKGSDEDLDILVDWLMSLSKQGIYDNNTVYDTIEADSSMGEK